MEGTREGTVDGDREGRKEGIKVGTPDGKDVGEAESGVKNAYKLLSFDTAYNVLFADIATEARRKDCVVYFHLKLPEAYNEYTLKSMEAKYMLPRESTRGEDAIEYPVAYFHFRTPFEFKAYI